MKTGDELHFMLNDNKTQCGEYQFGKDATTKIEEITCRECIREISRKSMEALVMLPLPFMHENNQDLNDIS